MAGEGPLQRLIHLWALYAKMDLLFLARGPQVAGDFVEIIGGTRCQGESCAEFREPLRGPFADAPRGSGDQHNPTPHVSPHRALPLIVPAEPENRTDSEILFQSDERTNGSHGTDLGRSARNPERPEKGTQVANSRLAACGFARAG